MFSYSVSTRDEWHNYKPRFDPTALFDFSPDAVDLAPSVFSMDPEEDGSKAGYSYTSVRLGLKLMLI